MAEVLTPSPEGSFYNSHKSSPASSSLFLGTSPPASSSSTPPTPRPIVSQPLPDHADHKERISLPAASLQSSRASSSNLSSLAHQEPMSISSGISLADKYSQQDDFEEDYPCFDGFLQSSEPSDSSDEQTESNTTVSDTTASDSPLPTPVADDTAIKQEPSQHVDYLSHDWREEDVWSSWRHIVSQRKVYGQQSRLENAAWRTWVKSKYHLPTVSPETLNWLKESDVTWLYGPLKPANKHPITHHESTTSTAVSRNASFTHKKPILKKRSMSEVMLQRSISASSLLKQAAASIEAQGRRSALKKSHERTYSDFVPGPNSEVPSRDQIDYFTSKSTSTSDTPSDCREKRHIRFDEKVEQCIAVECKRIDEEDEDEAIESETTASSSDSEDDGVVMMKRLKRPNMRRNTSGNGLLGSRNSSHGNLKTIETLPSTTLKYKHDAPQEAEQPQQASGLTRSWSSSKLSPSASQETLRPSRPSRNFLIEPEDDDDTGTAASSGWSFGASNPKSSLGAAASPSEETPPTINSPSSRHSANAAAVHQARANGGYTISRDSFDDDEDEAVRRAYGLQPSSSTESAEPCEMEGMRRTESGMFMPYEEDEDDLMAAGMFGRLSETVNTARDIAHVLWNVGWRK
ncbi:hypothetical protein Q7P37_009314 [Cladosporium fusiforme]